MRALAADEARPDGGSLLIRARGRLRTDLKLLDPGADVGLQYVQGDGAPPQDLIVEGADVEPFAELGAGEAAELLDLQLADLVGQGLAGPDDVAVDLHHDVVLGLARVLDEEVDRLLA